MTTISKRTQQRPTLAHRSQNGIPARALTLRGVDIRRPRQQQRHRRKHQNAQEDAEVARADGRGRGLDDEADGRKPGRQRDEGPAHLESVRQPADADDVEEAEEVGRGGEAVGLHVGEGAEVGDDGRDEEGEAGEGDVAGRAVSRVVLLGSFGDWQIAPAKVHDARDEGLGVFQAVEEFFGAQALLLADVEALVARYEVQGDLLLALVEEGRLLHAVRQEEPGHDGEGAGREALDEEEDAPGGDGAVDLRDAVGEGAAVGVGW